MTDIIIHVAGGVILKNRKVLGVSTRNRPGFLVPGGKIEPGESAKQALIRELKEELSIDVEEQDLKPYEVINEDAAHGDHNVGKLVHMEAFIVSKWQGEPKPTGESDEIAWLGSSDLKSTPLSSIMERHILPSLKKQGLID